MTAIWDEISEAIGSLSWARPWLAWCALAVPLAVGLLHVYDRSRRARLTGRLGELPVLGRVIATVSPRRRAIKDAVIAAGLSLIVLAIARPRREGERRVEIHGLDVAVAVDVSKSMLVEDVEPNRMTRARELATAVIDELPGDRIAPIVFAGAASHFPLTEDHEVVARFLSDLGPADLPPGSNLAGVLRVGRCVLRPDLGEDCADVGGRGHGGDPLYGESLDPPDPSHAHGRDTAKLEQKIERGKAIVIFTDGADPDSSAMMEVARARELGIAVVFVGIGTERGGIVYDVDAWTGHRTTEPKRLPDGSTVTSRRDDAGMRALAEAAGDAHRYLIANERGEVDPMPIVEALRGVTRGLAIARARDYHDVFEPFLFAGFMLLVIEVAIGTRRRIRYPEAR